LWTSCSYVLQLLHLPTAVLLPATALHLFRGTAAGRLLQLAGQRLWQQQQQRRFLQATVGLLLLLLRRQALATTRIGWMEMRREAWG
jgi:hypothetical protein